ncbi:HNH endonuclease [Massilia sp. CF038]|uniref:HNH endonuclease n=1 Tax=Massilia sp. CF038 TaxID=1881045 RepID=UPI000917FEC7|nr:HNH endonuclease [Massilia sp. CF038]SHH72853.1 HNH endonuclease [Massilia sp. CF038]
MMTQILVLDVAGRPAKWISPNDAAIYYANRKVAWDLGDETLTLRGGHDRNGEQSLLTVKPVIAIAGRAMLGSVRQELPLGDQNHMLFKRDRHMCAYCGGVFAPKDLSRDHVLASSRGGPNTFANCVTACKKCNGEKGDKLVEQFRPLLYVPYTPCRNEHFILQGRNILADQMAYLSLKLPQHSRLRS